MTNTAAPGHHETSSYRWVVLAVFALLNMVLQMHWVALAPVTREAAAFYHVSSLAIAAQSMMFMLVYIVVGMVASYVNDTFGTRIGVGIGAVLIGAFGLAKGFAASNFTALTICQIGLAVAQPFVINATTRISMDWFHAREHATATGIAILAQYVGIVIAMALTPQLVNNGGIPGALRLYGIAAFVVAIAFLVLFRGRSRVALDEPDDRIGVAAGLRHIARQRQMLLLLLMFFIGLGIFNAVTTWIEEVLAPRGFSAEQAGIAGAVMMIGGIIGASILPVFSDRVGKRVPFLIATMALSVPGMVGLTFLTSYPMLLAASFVLGFASMSAGPIGFQYGAELAHPAPESTTQGLMMVAGQVSGVLFIYGMHAFRTESGSMTPCLILFVAATLFNAWLCTRLPEIALTQAPAEDLPARLK
ncbi:MAG: MFS transporter [Candidatus Hydrogenedentes bacterium]|nr:MFS transporter [Candidatus Hydrogenedentota bacterium]